MHQFGGLVVTRALDELFAGRAQTLPASEVAEMLGLSTQAVYRWLNAGVIPAYKIGSTWFILRDELRDTLEAGSNLIPGAEPPPEE